MVSWWYLSGIPNLAPCQYQIADWCQRKWGTLLLGLYAGLIAPIYCPNI